MPYPPICEIYDARLALLGVGLAWRLPIAALHRERCAWRRLIQRLFARQRGVPAAVCEHHPAVLAIRHDLAHIALPESHAHGCKPALKLVTAPPWCSYGAVRGVDRRTGQRNNTNSPRSSRRRQEETHLIDMLPLVARNPALKPSCSKQRSPRSSRG